MWSSTALMIASLNPVYAALFLILVFFNAALFLIFLKVDFLGLIFLMIYVGAVAVLFLFVIMMLNIKKLQRDETTYFTMGVLLSLILFFQLFLFFIDGTVSFTYDSLQLIHYTDWFYSFFIKHNVSTMNFIHLGIVMYDHSFFVLILSGLLLLAGMVSAIVLTNKRRSNIVIEIKEQNVYKQNSSENQTRMFSK
jgi:NADH-quinone oxidoreductase subunit J